MWWGGDRFKKKKKVRGKNTERDTEGSITGIEQ